MNPIGPPAESMAGAVGITLIKNFDAKKFLTLAAARPDRENKALGGNFTEKNWALGTKVLKPDPLAD